MGNSASAASGGSGAGYHADIVITDGGYYTVTVGSGGTGYGGGRGATNRGGNGSATTFKKQGESNLISAGGGTGGYATPSGSYSIGAGGALSKGSIVEQTVYASRNGNNGGGRGSAGSVGGAAGPISGHTWGGSGSCSGNYNGGYADASYHGYFYIKYKGTPPPMYTFTISPTPNDATVTLTVNGVSYTQSSITVPSGTTVGWSVSKSGYLTQTGSEEVTEDTSKTITLVVNPILYYCYRYNAWGSWFYIYTSTEYTPAPPVGVSAKRKGETDATQATSSSQLQYTFTTTSGIESYSRYPAGDLYT